MQRSQRKPYFFRGVALGSAVLLALTACGGGSGKAPGEAGVDRPVVEETEEPEEEPTGPELLGTWPLTGVQVWSEPGAEESEDPSAEEYPGPVDAWEAPVLSIKIENSRASRPQDGLERADVVWEQMVEGGITRFVAMFHSDLPETAGPIRSVRAMDAPIIGPIGGVLAFSGGAAEYRQRLTRTGVAMVDNDRGGAGFYRKSGVSREHSLFGYPGQFFSVAGDRTAPENVFSFAYEDDEPSAVAAGSKADGVNISFPASKPSWDWNGSVWERSESGNPAIALSGERMVADNVIVAMVKVRDTGRRDASGASVPETILHGSGTATVFTEGHTLEVTWEKGGDTDPFILRTADGDPVLLKPGKTWIELVPSARGGITIKGAN